ncbi:MAG: hypothetical protein P8M80_17675 [Pirellulaceae bacterium]|nr:hypothetical protein [Pirellulaceae bacterium]
MNSHASVCVFFLLLSSLVLDGISVTADDILGQFKAREIGPAATGGRIVDIEADPENPFRILVASASGGLWLTENNGTTWNNIFERENTISIGDIAIDPKDFDVIWVGTGEANNQRSSLWGDGVYKSTDRGKTWNNTGLVDSHHIGRIVIDPNDPEVVYVAALGHLYSSNKERGLFKTKDGGKTWNKALFVNEQVGVVDVVIDPANSNVIYAATYERLRRAWDFDGAGPGSAIYKSNDAGHTWKKLTSGLPAGNIGRIGIAVYPQNPEILYATVSNQNLAQAEATRPGQPSSDEKRPKVKPGEAKSENEIVQTPFGFYLQVENEKLLIAGVESASQFARQGLKNGQQVVSFAGVGAERLEELKSVASGLKPSDSVLIQLSSEGTPREIRVRRPVDADPGQREIGGEIYRSDDAGSTWKKVNRTALGGMPAYYYGQIRIDPNDENRLYVLSIPLNTSTDGGKTWSQIGRSVHVDHHAIWINPNNPAHLMLGNDGGFHQSYDYGKTWDHVFNLPLAQFYAVSVDMQQPYHVYGGLQDNGSWAGPSRTNSRSGISKFDWYRVGGGDGFYVQVDPVDANIVIAESQFGAIFRSYRATGDRKWIRPRASTSEERYRFNWNSPIVMSTHDSRVVYFGGNKLFKSMNRGDDWEEISDDLTTVNEERIKGNVPYCTITTISESRLKSDLLMVGTDDGKVQLTNDGGSNWTDLSENFPFKPGDWWCSRVVLSGHDAAVAYACFTGYREDDFRSFVFKTSDLGATWHAINGNLPAESVNVIVEDPINPNLLFVGTEFGVYASLDGGLVWKSFGELPRVSVHDMVIHPRDRDLVIGSHGRGIFIVDDISPLQQMKKSEKNGVKLLAPRRAVTYRGSATQSISGDRKFSGANPSRTAKIWYLVNEKVDQKHQIAITNIEGGKRQEFEIENRSGLNFVTLPMGTPAGGRRRGRSQAAPAFSLKPGIYRIELFSNDESGVQVGEIQTVILRVEAL